MEKLLKLPNCRAAFHQFGHSHVYSTGTYQQPSEQLLLPDMQQQLNDSPGSPPKR